MRKDQRPPTLGIVAAVAYVFVALAPYLAASLGPDESEGAAAMIALPVERALLELYFTAGLAGPDLLSLFAVVTVVLFAAGRQGRSEPDLIAGVTLVVGIVLCLGTVHWALAVPEAVIANASGPLWFEYHRWLTAFVSLGVPIAAGWYARVLGLL